jgi:nucleoside-diphosphate-sugar epimerase
LILITGGAGFIGKHLVGSCLGRYDEVTIIDKVPMPQEFSAKIGLAYRQADAYRVESLLPRRKQPGLRIVHLAAETSVNRSLLRPLSSVRANVGVTCALLEFARRTDSENFIFASSAAVYGERKAACREADSPDPRSPYAASKLAGEYYCRVFAKTYGIPVSILRFFNVYGPGQSNHYSGVVTAFLKAVSQGRPPTIHGDGKQTRDFVFVKDIVEAILRSLDTRLPPGIIMNIGTGRAITVNTLALKVLRVLRKESIRPIHLPAKAGEVRFSRADISLARSKIRFQPRHDLDNGLRLTSKWLTASRK